jgi:hypothetical protein
MTQRFIIRFLPASDAQSIEAQWDRLYENDPEANFFLTRDFLTPVFSRYPEAGAFGCFRDDELVGLLPTITETVWDRRKSCYRTEFRMAGAKHWADYCGFLIDQRFANEVLDSFAWHFMNSGWARIRFRNLKMSKDRQNRFFSHFDQNIFGVRDVQKMINGGTTNNLICPVIELPDNFDSFVDALSKNNRKKMRKHLRRVQEGEYRIHLGTKDNLGDFERMWISQWSAKPDAAKLARRYALIIKAGLENGTVRMPILSDSQGHILGLICNFHDEVRKDIGVYVSARDSDAGSIPIALILHGDAIRSAIAEGYQTYDFLRGDEQYKFDMGAEPQFIRYCVLRRRSGAPISDLMSRLSCRGVLREIPKLTGSEDAGRLNAACMQLSQFL